MDESKFGKRKYNRGKRVEGVWVFGGIERDSNPPKCFFETVEDRSAATFIPIIKRWILPGTTISSDCWKAYSSLQEEGYIHTTVNHISSLFQKQAHTPITLKAAGTPSRSHYPNLAHESISTIPTSPNNASEPTSSSHHHQTNFLTL